MNLKKITLGALLLAFSGMAYGASIDHIQNYTPEYNANPALNGAINPGTSAYYNPAGLMEIENGRYIQVGLSAAMGNQKMEAYGETYEADSLDFIPNFMMVDKNDERAWYLTVGGLAGGAAFDYNDGVPTMKTIEQGLGSLPLFPNLTLDGNEYAKGSNMYAQTTVGRAWPVTDKLSLSAAGRMVYGIRSMELYMKGDYGSRGKYLQAEMDAERTGFGYGFVLGANYKATEKLNLALRYDSQVRMNFDGEGTSYDNLTGGVLEDLYAEYFNKTRRDLPAILALGAQYEVTEKWTTYLSGNYYFNESADLDDEYRADEKDHYKDGYEVAIGSQYWVSPKVAWMVGANYAVTGAEEETYHDSEFALDSIMIGTGIKYKQNEDTTWVVSINHYIYDSVTTSGKEVAIPGLITIPADDVTYSKEYTAVGVSYTRRF